MSESTDKHKEDKDKNCGNKTSAAEEKSAAVIKFLRKPSETNLENTECNTEIERSQAKLNQIIIKLANDSRMIDDHTEENYLQQFNLVYSDGSFRHSYSEITRIIFDCGKNGDELHTLTLNLLRLHNIIENKYSRQDGISDSFIKAFRKLYDHFNLEIARLGYMMQIHEEYKNNINDANKKIIDYKTEIDKSQKDLANTISLYDDKVAKNDLKLSEYDKKINSLSTQSMTVLGIFSAIVFAFTGGFSIIGSTFNNGVSTPYRYRYIFTILLLCFSLFNILVGLISSLFKLSAGKVLAWPCKYSKSADIKELCKGCQKEDCRFPQRIIKRYPLIFTVDSLLILGMLLVFILWLLKK